MDMTTLLQRHRLMLQARHSSLSICPDHENLDSHSLFDHQSLHGTLQSDHTGAYSVVSSGNCSSAAPKTRRRCNSSGYGKRKSEIDVEEQEEEEETGEEESEITIKAERETSSCKYRFKGSEVQKQNQSDVIHVRARRGQATDSHSLAERARREKISKKMKCLQDLVPGCDRVTGKAGMLDEIINYVQSLQKQVEFLSMKLVAVNHRLDFSGDNMLLKEAPASYAGCFPSAASTAVTQFEPANPSSLHYNLMQHHGSSTTISIDQSQSMPEKSSLPIPEALLESSFSQMPSWELDWQSLLNPSFQ